MVELGQISNYKHFLSRDFIIIIFKHFNSKHHIMNRFFFLLILITTIVSCGKKPVDHTVLMYIGTSNNDSLKGIEYCYFDTVSGQLSDPLLASAILNPNYLEVDTENNILYAVGDKAKQSIVKSYKVDKKSAQITPISEEVVPGKGSCYVALDKTSKQLMVANYTSGSVVSYKVNDGNLKFVNSVQHYGNGPYEDRQTGPHAHSIDIDPKSNWIYSADLGADKLMVYQLNRGALELTDSVMCESGVGPRHFDFSPNGKLMAVLNELNCTVTTYAKNNKGIYSKELQTVTLLPDSFTAFSKAADIHFSADGKFLYASNRGFDSIAVFKVNGNTLQFVEFVSEGIEWPRNFAIDPSGNYLLVANQNQSDIIVFKRDKATGKLSAVTSKIEVQNPICIKFFN